MRSSDDDAEAVLDLPELHRSSELRKINGPLDGIDANPVAQREIGELPARTARHEVTVEAIGCNAVLEMLHVPEIDVVVNSGMLVELASGEQIYRRDEAIEHVYLPVDCVLSFVTTLQDGSRIEVGSCGREGVSAISLLLGATRSAHECYCQVPGTAIKVEVAVFQSLRANARFESELGRYIKAYVHTLGQFAACNALHNDCERLSRSLLTTQDRVGAPSFHLSHKYLETVLGVTPSAVKTSTEALQRAGFIRCVDGLITVLDRTGLKGVSCECYSIARKHFEHLMPRANVWVSNTPLFLN